MIASAITLGIAQGLQHSLEPDHLAAVSVLVHETRTVRGAAWLGVVWGLGHTASLIAVSAVVTAVGAALPAAADRGFTLAVGLLLMVLGARALRRPSVPAADARARTPLGAALVGGLHGLAGSSALTAMVVALLPTTATRLVYVALFGLGSILGMALVSGCAGAWLRHVRRPAILTAMQRLVAVISIGIGAATVAAGMT